MNVVRYLMVWAMLASLMLLLLGCFLPASWALAWYGDRWSGFSLQQVSGTVWRGQAMQLRDPAGLELGSLHWQLSPSVLLGRPQLQLELHGAEINASGEIRQDPGQRIAIDHVQIRATPAALAALLGQPAWPYAGQLYLEVSHALVLHGWPMVLEAQLIWRDAAVRAPGQALPLGNLMLLVRSQQGVVSAELDDDASGPLRVHGQGRLSPLGWSAEAAADSRRANPALAAWLAGFGAPDSHGMVRWRRSGGLLNYLH